MRRNLLRERLNAGKPTVGTHILSAWPTLVELIGHSKQYDYVEFTAEYAPFDHARPRQSRPRLRAHRAWAA